MRTNLIYIFVTILGLTFLGCEDSPPTDYIQQNIVDGYLIVGQPIGNIRIMRTLPVTDSFNYENSLIRDASAVIKYDDKILNLQTLSNGSEGYFYPDTTVKVLAGKTYQLEITLKDGTKMTGQTTTPKEFSWIKPFPDSVYFPNDTINFSDGDTIKYKWESGKNSKIYLIRIKSLDTLEYGKYLQPPTDEKNYRVHKPFTRGGNPVNTDITNWSPLPSNETPIVWSYLKWYGQAEISILSPDYNFLRWSLLYFRSSSYNSLLGNIEGGLGNFGSASEIRKKIFVFKPKK